MVILTPHNTIVRTSSGYTSSMRSISMEEIGTIEVHDSV